jgi:hypothetical protein
MAGNEPQKVHLKQEELDVRALPIIQSIGNELETRWKGGDEDPEECPLALLPHFESRVSHLARYCKVPNERVYWNFLRVKNKPHKYDLTTGSVCLIPIRILGSVSVSAPAVSGVPFTVGTTTDIIKGVEIIQAVELLWIRSESIKDSRTG